ncbi:MAG: hypothetical protein KA807_14310 [Prolixibacteraceae bacterium]|nr:hypothetical protein [Prolixibacteraceae bacterium]
MKNFISLIIITVLLSVSGFAQTNEESVQVAENDSLSLVNDQQIVKIDSIISATDSTEAVTETEEIEETEEDVQYKDSTKTSEKDTVHIRIGKHAIEITTDEDKTHIDVERIDEFESRWERKEREQYDRKHYGSRKRFDGHWMGIDFGGNQLLNTNYSLYPEGTVSFMETSPEKSFEVNINLFEYSFGFSSYFGLVTGLGVNFNDYKFKNRATIIKDENGVIQPSPLPEGDFRLSKLSTVFITAPLLVEFQIPGQWDEDRLFITAGVIGGVKINEYTKTQIGEEKRKDKGDHNLSPVRWGYTARVGFESFGLYATYYNTKLFKSGLGPDTTPFTVGVTFTF